MIVVPFLAVVGLSCLLQAALGFKVSVVGACIVAGLLLAAERQSEE